MAIEFTARVLIDGSATGKVLKLAQPLSFWGGVNPTDGTITQPVHPDFGAGVADKILVLPGMIGSSSSSAIMLELINAGVAPAALIMADIDAILALGVIAGTELGLPALPVLQSAVDAFETGQQAEISSGGGIRLGGSA